MNDRTQGTDLGALVRSIIAQSMANGAEGGVVVISMVPQGPTAVENDDGTVTIHGAASLDELSEEDWGKLEEAGFGRDKVTLCAGCAARMSAQGDAEGSA